MSSNKQKVQNVKNIKDTNTEPKLKLIDPSKNMNNKNMNNTKDLNLIDMKCLPTNIIVQDPASGQFQKLFSCTQ